MTGMKNKAGKDERIGERSCKEGVRNKKKKI
jgi:hypothetical protein